jgi:transcriptional regulator with XRE-family HTH domain
MQTHVVANIRAELARRGKTQEDLAEALGIARQNISQRLRNRVSFRIEELQAVADFLGIPIADLLINHESEASA